MKTHILDSVLILTISCYYFLVLVSSNSEICSNSACHPREPWIRFPFRLKDNQPKECGYPGFDLTCDSSMMTTILLQNSSFNVQAIDYASQEIWLYDPERCLAKLLLTLDLSDTPFTAVFKQDFAFFNCSSENSFNGFHPIGCLSGPSYNVFATSSNTQVHLFKASKCNLITSITVPLQSPYYKDLSSDDLSGDLRLAWKTPNCGKCESRGGRCGLKNNSTNDIECRIQHGLPRGARYAIIVGAGIPGVLFLTGLLFCIIRRLKAFGSRRRQPIIEYTTTHVEPQPTDVTSGLDYAVIQTFPKTVLGQSKRLPNPEDNVCPICLGEYKPKETLRTIPACQHCFHSNCIDEWLQLNATCPVCRKNQKQSTPVPGSAPASDHNV